MRASSSEDGSLSLSLSSSEPLRLRRRADGCTQRRWKERGQRSHDTTSCRAAMQAPRQNPHAALLLLLVAAPAAPAAASAKRRNASSRHHHCSDDESDDCVDNTPEVAIVSVIGACVLGVSWSSQLVVGSVLSRSSLGMMVVLKLLLPLFF
jgi:hypothetical protein